MGIPNGVLRLAAKQFGVIGRDQALASGMTARAIDGRIHSREWERMLPRVFRLASTTKTWEQLAMAAVLWAGDCVVTHRSAARLHGLEGVESQLVEITTNRVLRSPEPRIIIHVAQDLERRDLARVGPFLTTTPTRTLIDCFAVCDEASAEDALEDALRKRKTDVPRLERRLKDLRKPGKKGVAKLEKILKIRGLQAPTASEMETRLLQLLRKANLPAPHRQYVVRHAGKVVGRLDFAYADRGLGIEFDSAQFHQAETDRPDELRRLNELTLLSWRIVPLPGTT